MTFGSESQHEEQRWAAERGWCPLHGDQPDLECRRCTGGPLDALERDWMLAHPPSEQALREARRWLDTTTQEESK